MRPFRQIALVCCAAVMCEAAGTLRSLYAQSPITVVSPHGGEQVASTTLSFYVVRWTASDIPGIDRFLVDWEVPGGGGGACSAPSSERRCEWSEPSPMQNVTIVVTAVDRDNRALASARSEPFDVVEVDFDRFRSFDIGDVGRSGGVGRPSPTTWVIHGAGDDIWGTADAFHFMFQDLHFFTNMDATITITDIEGTEPWTKVGVMVRHGSGPGSPYDFVFASKERGLAYQRRREPNQPALHTGLGPSVLPVTIRLSQRDNRFAFSVLRSPGNWEQVTEGVLSGAWLMGLAVTSHDRNVLASGRFEMRIELLDPSVEIISPAEGEVVRAGQPYTIRWEQSDNVVAASVSYSPDGGATWQPLDGCQEIVATSCVWLNPEPNENPILLVQVVSDQDIGALDQRRDFKVRSAGGTMLPPGWSALDIGAVRAPGSASFDSSSGTYEVEGSGSDVWGTADELHFASTVVTGDFEFTARVTAVEDLHRWVKAGLMAREALTAGARHGFAIATPRAERGVVFQRRPFESGTSVSTTGGFFPPPLWLKLIRRGHTLLAYTLREPNTDGWLLIDTQTYSSLAPSLNVGFAVSSHIDGTLATARFDNVSLVPLIPWTSADIGAVGLRGSTGVDPVRIEMSASGADIWDTADAFRYRYHTLDGDGSITVKVESLGNADPWSKAGLMIRESTAANSKQVMALVSASKGLALQYRRITGGNSAQAAAADGVAPRWLRLTRTGHLFNAYTSSDGMIWSSIGSVSFPMNTSALIGLAVTSHLNTTRVNATFSNLEVQQ